jgi:glycosyltransferase involved in cell wall biosynthesis
MQHAKDASLSGRHIVFFNWRDTANPEGGGSERYVEMMARGLVARGADVTVFCASHDQAPPDEVVDGVRFRRRGSKLGIYVQGLLHLILRRFGRVDLVVDVQNGLPFFTRLATRRPVVVLVHHVHREQWPVVYPGLMGKVGWWIESWLAPRLYRGSQYVAVSQATRQELIQLGIDEHRIAVVHNGTEPAPEVTTSRSEHPTLCVVGRLVPHKQVEHAFDTVAALRPAHPEVRLTVVGDGWWADPLKKDAAEKGLLDVVTFEGHVTDQRKHEVYAASWLMLLPSLKEGWGLVVGEAGSHGVPTIAYESAGGTRESIVSGQTGLLVHDREELTGAVEELLGRPDELRRLGDNARTFSRNFAWENSQTSFAAVVQAAAAGRRLDVEDPLEPGGSA